jgi:hypothetical protein
MRLVQLSDSNLKRHVAIVDEPRLVLLKGFDSVYRIALIAIERSEPLADVVAASASTHTLDYEEVYAGASGWSILPAFDHPDEPALCLVSGTGLTHLKSAQSRDTMHAGESDSIRMYRAGVEGGRPSDGEAGVQPEWFYKGTGAILRAHGAPLEVPGFALDGGDEGEIAGCYIVDYSGSPKRVGMAQGNEFSDHVMERQNYLYLAPSKLRTCSIGPELVLGPAFHDVRGRASVLRGGETLWSAELASGESNMCHSLANLEHHHFKYPQHRRINEVHVHFFGAGAFSFSSGVELKDGDEMEVAFEGFGRPLRNELRRAGGDSLVRVTAL